MSVIFGSARSSYGQEKAGDQNGKEVSTQGYYNPAAGYWLGFMLEDEAKAKALAEAMIKACKNDNIGYSQNFRMTGRQAYVKAGSIEKMGLCQVDCSSLVNLCLYSIGINLPNFNTASEPAVLRNSDLFKEVRVSKESDCKTGMILVTPTKGHTGIITQGSNSYGQVNEDKITVPQCKPMLKKGSKGVRVSQLQAILKLEGYTVAITSTFDDRTDAALKSYQKAKGLEVDGIYGPKTMESMRQKYGR